MADKKVDRLTGEVNVDLQQECNLNPEEMSTGPNPDLLVVHCKPVYNYQSVEFDVIIRNHCAEKDLAFMEDVYSDMLRMLVRVSENAPQKDAKPVAPVEEPASEKQKEILRNFHIDFKPDITKKQAHALIKKSMDQEIF